MDLLMKYEQVCVMREVVALMETGQLVTDDFQALPWQLVGETNVHRILGGENHVWVNVTGMSGCAHKFTLGRHFLANNSPHQVYDHRDFPWLSVVIRSVPQDTLRLVLDLKLESSTSIYAAMRDSSGQTVISSNFPAGVVLTVAGLKSVIKALLAGATQRSVFAALEVYYQHNDLQSPGLSGNTILWRPTWQLPHGSFTQPSRRHNRKVGPEHPTMSYWLSRGR